MIQIKQEKHLKVLSDMYKVWKVGIFMSIV
jgi:hypothetical protein